MVLGNLIQINARGEQERLLYGNPQMTYFKKVYPSCSNFSRSYLNVPYSGTGAFDSKVNIKLPHNGDLLSNIYISLELPLIDQSSLNIGKNDSYYCNGIGYKIIKSISLKFNGKLIETLTGEMISHIYNYQFNNVDKNNLDRIFYYNDSIKNFMLTDQKYRHNSELHSIERRGPIQINIPIPFFFTRNFESNLPLCAMGNTEVEISIEFEKLENLLFTVPSTVSITNFNKLSIISEVINLDGREKQLFKTSDLNYLIKLNSQICTETIDGNNSGTITIDLNAKNATTMLYFSFLPTINEYVRNYFNYSIVYLNDYAEQYSFPNANELYEKAYAPHYYKSNNNKIIENLTIEADNNKLYDSNVLDLPFIINNTPFICNNNKIKYQLGIYNFDLDCDKYISGSLNFSRLIKKTISFEIGSDFKKYISIIPGSSLFSALDYQLIKFKCYSCYFNNLIIKDGLAGLKYN